MGQTQLSDLHRTRLAPSLAAASSLVDQGNFAEAERLLRILLKADSGNFDLLLHLGVVCARQGRFEEALKLLRRAINRNPNSAQAYNMLGGVLQSLGRHEEAAARYKKAIAINPKFADAYNNLGNALAVRERPVEAVECFEKALSISPGLFETHNNIANTLRALNRFEDAISHYKSALALRSDVPSVYQSFGRALQSLDRHEEAIEQFEKWLALQPNSAEAHSYIGNALWEWGQFDKSRRAHERAVALEPKTPGYLLPLVRSRRLSRDDPYFIALEKLAQDLGDASDLDRTNLHFALGKAYADLSQHEVSFRHYLEANALYRRTFQYDEAKIMRWFERIRVAYTAELFAAKRGLGHPSEVPIFIVGMPRSGTTLIEQILASHPQVFAAGEREDFELADTDAVDAYDVDKSCVDRIASFTQEELSSLGARYLDRLTRRAPTALRITDKSLTNFRNVGLIHLALPNARIIHARRNPIDTCISCFSILFGGLHPFAYDLRELGRYHRSYQTMMEHWRSVLPPERPARSAIRGADFGSGAAGAPHSRALRARMGRCLSCILRDEALGQDCERTAGPSADLSELGRTLACLQGLAAPAIRRVGH